LITARERMQDTLRIWDQKLTATPPDTPALLLETLPASTPPTVNARVAPLRRPHRAAPRVERRRER
jgi:hypothetical protein